MDPTTLILTALATGASEVLKDTATQAVKDAYDGLKALIKRKFKGNSDAEMILRRHEQQPETWKAPLEEELDQTDVAQDQEVLAAAQKVMTLIQPQQAAMGKYNVQITGNVQGFAQGDNQQVTMHFGDETKEDKSKQEKRPYDENS